MLEYFNDLDLEDNMNKVKIFDIFKTKSKKINSNILKKIEKHEKISNFFIEYTKIDINSISKTLHNLDIKLSKIINNNDNKINITEIDNYISCLSKIILFCIYLIKIKKIISKKLDDIHQYLSNNFLLNVKDDIYTQKYYEFEDFFNSFFNNNKKERNSSQIINSQNCFNIFQPQKNDEKPSFGEILKKNFLFEKQEKKGDSTPRFIKTGTKNNEELIENSEQKNESNNIINNKENDIISFNGSNCALIVSENTSFSPLQKLSIDSVEKNHKNKSKDEKKEIKNHVVKEKKLVNKNKSNNSPINKGSRNVKRNSLFSISSKNHLYFKYFNEKRKDFQSDKNLKKSYNDNLHESNKEVFIKKLNKYQCSKDVFVELFVLANELYKNDEITDEEKIIFKQLIIKKSEKLLKVFIDNKESRNDLIYSIKKMINKILKNNIHKISY